MWSGSIVIVVAQKEVLHNVNKLTNSGKKTLGKTSHVVVAFIY
jgi:hypothetical protein